MERREFLGDNFLMIYNVSMRSQQKIYCCTPVCFVQLLTFCLTDYIPSSTMIPQRRFSTLLTQSREYQRHRCLYHNSLVDPSSSSLFSDHTCDKESFPRITTTILEVHSDEVWNVAWSHDGTHLASASKDKTAIIWRIGVSWTDSQCLTY